MRTHLIVLALLAACGSTESNGRSGNHQMETETPETLEVHETSATETRLVDGFFSAEGAPDPHACETAADCMGDTIPDADNPCCNNPRSLRPYSRAYRQWIGEWRAAECEDVQCPPPPNPMMPPSCSFEMQCVEGTCADQC